LGILGLGAIFLLSKKTVTPPPDGDTLPTPVGNYLTGKITDSTGAPIANVKLQLFNETGYTTYTNSHGDYIFNDVVAMHYSFNLEKDGYKFYLWGYTIDPGANYYSQAMESEIPGMIVSKIYNNGFRVAQAL